MNNHNNFMLLKQRLKNKDMDLYIEPLNDYLSLLEKWNKAYNLTAIRDRRSMIDKHIMDSLAISGYIEGDNIIDVGTGAGLPGIPLAITHPNKSFVLLDSNGKKIRFLNEVKRQLSLSNVKLEQSRVESYHPSRGFDTVISRAFTDLGQMVSWTTHLLKNDGVWLAMKGKNPVQELKEILYPYSVQFYDVECIDAERCCVLINKRNKDS